MVIILAKCFYFLRHGETDWNKKGLIQGTTDIPLNKRGVEQATNVASFVASHDYCGIYSSYLSRARHTAEIIGHHSSDRRVQIVLGLEEERAGTFEGTTMFKEFLAAQRSEDFSRVNVEGLSELRQRVSRALNSILSTSHRPLIVSHGGVFQHVCQLLNLQVASLENTALVRFMPPPSHDGSWTMTPLQSAHYSGSSIRIDIDPKAGC